MDKIQIHQEVCERLSLDYVDILEDTGDSFSKIRQEFGDVAFMIRLEEKKERFKRLMNKESVSIAELQTIVNDMSQDCLMELVELESQRMARACINDIHP